MKRFATLPLLAFLALPVMLSAQAGGVVEGVVSLPTEALAHRATVMLVQLSRIVETDEEGRYRFENVPGGTYEVVAIMSAMSAPSQVVEVSAGVTVSLDIQLVVSRLRQQITVTATGREELTFEAVPSVTTLDSFDLSEAMATSIGEVLNGQLGVAKRSFGAGNARPVVRGFDGDRVLVMQDGVRVGSLGAQSGDHAEPIDTSSVERVEVVKGPATLLYGSNAVGGVVNAVSSHQEIHQRPHQGLRGQVSTAFGAGNEQAGGSFSSEYGFENWLVWVGGGGQRTDDYSTPIGKIENSKSRISNGSAGIGWYSDGGFVSAGYKANDGRSGIPFAGSLLGRHEQGGEEEAAREEEVEAIDVVFRRHNVHFTGGLRNLGSTLEGFELSLNYTDWNQDEVETLRGGIQEVGTTFENKQFVYRGVFEQARRGVLSGSFGFWGMTRDYESRGDEALSPPVDKRAFAAFALEELEYDRVKVQFGGRLEHTRYEPTAPGADGPRRGISRARFSNRAFTGLSAGIGARFDLWSGGAFVANYTSSFRAPALEELYNFGPHVGNLTFEIGNPDLERERSNGLDFSLRHQQSRIRGEANFFYYDLDNFVFLAPTGEIEGGLTEAVYDQGDSRFLGAEVKLDLGINDSIWLSLALDMVDTRLEATDGTLPRIPPLRGTVGFDFRSNDFSVRPEVVMADSRDDVFSTETSTPGYTVFNLRASYTIPQQHLAHHLSVNFFNIGERLYRNHVSFIKDLAPEIGRGIRFSYAVKYF